MRKDEFPLIEAYADSKVNEVLDKIRAEIAEYGSIMVSYAITKDTKTDKGIEKLVIGVLKQAKEQVLEIIDKYKAESEGITMDKLRPDKLRPCPFCKSNNVRIFNIWRKPIEIVCNECHSIYPNLIDKNKAETEDT